VWRGWAQLAGQQSIEPIIKVVKEKFVAKLGNLPVYTKCRAEENKQAEDWVITWSWSDRRA